MSSVTLDTTPGEARGERRRRADGERSRRTILDAAARLATVEGIEGLSIGGLAKAIGMSKSGLYAHFGPRRSCSSRRSRPPRRCSTLTSSAQPLRLTQDLPRPGAVRTLPRVHRKRCLPRRLLLRLGSGRARYPTRPGTRPNRGHPVQLGPPHRVNLREAQDQHQLDPHANVEQLTFKINAFIAHATRVHAPRRSQSLRPRAPLNSRRLRRGAPV